MLAWNVERFGLTWASSIFRTVRLAKVMRMAPAAVAIIFGLHILAAAETELPIYQPNQLKADLVLMRSALEEAHADLYRYTSKADLDREWENAAKSIDHPMTVLDFYRVVGPILALIKDGHLGWSLSSEVTDYLGRVPVLPFAVRLIERTPVVFRDLSGSDRSAVGLEIVSINGVAVAKLVDDIWKRQMGDGDVISSRRRGVGAGFARELVRICNLRPPYETAFREPKTNKAETRRLDGIAPAELTRRWKNDWPNDFEMRMERPLSELEFFDETRIARIRVPSFGSSEADAKRRDLRGFFANSFNQLKERKTRALIVDVRDNGGGEDEAGQILASYLIDKPFRYYRDLTVRNTSFKFADYISSPDPIPAEMVSRGTDELLHVVGHPNLGIKTPRQPGFRGSLIILMNGGSFSTAGEFLSAIRSKCVATFIGEESAAAYGGNNSGFEPGITLPNTKLVLRIPLVAYYLDISDKYPARRGILPDEAINPTVEDMTSGKDKELEVALSIARKAIQPK